MSELSPISSIGLNPATASPVGLKPNNIGSESFKKVFSEVIHQTNNQLQDADKTVKDFVEGNIGNPQDVMIRLEEAHLALQFTVQLRNKVVEAYQEISRMQF